MRSLNLLGDRGSFYTGPLIVRGNNACDWGIRGADDVTYYTPVIAPNDIDVWLLVKPPLRQAIIRISASHLTPMMRTSVEQVFMKVGAL